jgi:hypothetical protein
MVQIARTGFDADYSPTACEEFFRFKRLLRVFVFRRRPLYLSYRTQSPKQLKTSFLMGAFHLLRSISR